MKNYPIIALLLFASCGISYASELIGVWKSNEALTLNSMSSVDGITSTARDYFENDFFGHLINEYRETEERAYLDNCEEDCDSDKNCLNFCDESKAFTPYELLEETEKQFIINSYDELSSQFVKQTLYRESNCYYLVVTKWKFKEYFCRN